MKFLEKIKHRFFGKKYKKTKEQLELTYSFAIQYLADNGVNSVVANSSPLHARIIMSNIYRTAQKYVYVFARNLDSDVSRGEYLIWLKDFLEKKDVKLKVILESEPLPNNTSEAIPLILKYRDKNEENKSRITIGYANDKSKLAFFDGELNHFTIADDRMYRLEIDTNHFIAQANFNDEKTVKELEEHFNSIDYTALN